tara:strand:- start:1424 stop:1684 length:261 start_codon:yes stop_codon:yes gene_type:complete
MDETTVPTDFLTDLVRVLLDPSEEERGFAARVLLSNLLREQGVPQEELRTFTEESITLIEAIHRGEDIQTEDVQDISDRVFDSLQE